MHHSHNNPGRSPINLYPYVLDGLRSFPNDVGREHISEIARRIAGRFQQARFTQEDVAQFFHLAGRCQKDDPKDKLSAKKINKLSDKYVYVLGKPFNGNLDKFRTACKILSNILEKQRIKVEVFYSALRCVASLPIEGKDGTEAANYAKSFLKQEGCLDENDISFFQTVTSKIRNYLGFRFKLGEIAKGSLDRLNLKLHLAVGTLARAELPEKRKGFLDRIDSLLSLDPVSLDRSILILNKLFFIEVSDATKKKIIGFLEDCSEEDVLNALVGLAACSKFSSHVTPLLSLFIEKYKRSNPLSDDFVSQIESVTAGVINEDPEVVLDAISYFMGEAKESLRGPLLFRDYIGTAISLFSEELPSFLAIIKGDIRDREFANELDYFLDVRSLVSFKRHFAFLIELEGFKGLKGNLFNLLQLRNNYRAGLNASYSEESKHQLRIAWNLSAATRNEIISKLDQLTDKKRITEYIKELVGKSGDPHYVGDVLGNRPKSAQSFSNYAYSGNYPFHPGSEEHSLARSQTIEIMRAMYDIYRGFSSLTYEARSVDDNHWMLERFLVGHCNEARLINCSVESFPGPGIVGNGLDITKIFGQDRFALTEDDDPYQRFKQEIIPWGAAEFDLLKDTKFFFSRGFLAISCASSSRFFIANTHYSLIVFNEHFYNDKGAVAYLIPTDRLEAFYEMLTLDIDHRDLPNAINLSGKFNNPEELIQFLCPDISKLLNLGWGSNIGSGLCNTFPPKSSPYFDWEVELNGHTKDRYGHVHNSHISGRYVSGTSDSDYNETYRRWAPLRQAHNEVYAASLSLLNLFDLMRLSLSFYHKGFSAVSGEGEQREILLEDTDLGEAEVVATDDNYRMLEEAYSWHTHLKAKRAQIGQFPLLRLVPLFSYSVSPAEKIYLDTYDLTLNVGTNKFNLPNNSDGRGAQERQIWGEFIVPRFAVNSSEDLRFVSRDFLK